MEFGIFSFGEQTTNARTGRRIDAATRIHQLIELAVVADEAGLDVVGVGEHHRDDFAVTTPAVVLSAMAQATKRIRLTSTVTVLSTADPVRVFEDFTALDLISNGRAELTAGRGAYTESFPLYGRSLREYDALFEENLDLLLTLNRDARVTWRGTFRSALDDVMIAPRPVHGQLPVWVAVGGTPASVERAARLNLPMYLAILGNPAGFAPLAKYYRDARRHYGHDATPARLGVTSHFYVGEQSQRARDDFYPAYASYIGENMPNARGRALSRTAFDEWASPTGALFVGSPAEVAEKILWEREILGHERFLAQVGLGGLDQDLTRRSVELFASDVVPLVRQALKS